MKETFQYTHLSLLVFILVFITSCRGQEKINKSNHNQEIDALIFRPAASSDLQIAEYIRNIFQDKNGDLWFGTNNYGVVHYSGDSLSYYSNDQGFNGGQITGITEDLEKNIWFATNQGVVKYDWSTKENGEKLFTNYTDQELFKGGHFWSIFADSKGNVWAGAGKELFRHDGDEWATFELPYSNDEKSLGLLTGVVTWSIMEDANGKIWFGTNGNGAIIYDPSVDKRRDKTYKQFTTKDGLTDNSVDQITEDRNGNIWMGTRYGGVSLFNGETFTNYTEQDSIGNNEVCVIYEDKAGNIWFSSEGYGIYRFDGSSFSNFGMMEGLGVKAVQTIFEDSEGRFWAGGGGGLYRYNPAAEGTDGKLFLNVTKNGPWK